jgi:GNAT superfamily N-acetyltransferase
MITIRKFKISDTKKTALLIRETFLKFNNKEGVKKGVENYLSYFSTEKSENFKKIQNIFINSPIFFVAVEKDKIIGIIRGRKDRIVNLFVDGKYHGQGVGRNLIKKFEKECIKLDSKKINIRASLFATLFYVKMGYKKTTGIRNFKNLKIQPMQKTLID